MRAGLFFLGLSLAAPLGWSADAQAQVKAKQQSPLVGSWLLVKAESVRPDGTTLPLGMLGGRNQTGIVMYSADGWMSTHIAAAERPKVSRDDPAPRSHPPERGAAVANSYYGYYGRYEANPAAGTVKHYVTQALHPDEIGQEYERRFKVEGDLLTLSTPPNLVEGEQRFNRLTWRRVNRNQQTVIDTRK
jgi:hypothetical protein